jgi:hypothetical protein
MGYMDNKAAGKAPRTATTEDLKASGNTTGSLERNQPVPKHAQGTTTTKYDVGSIVRVRGNSKSTGTVKQPTALALGSKKSVKPATSNPDGQVNRPNYPAKTAVKA